MNNKFICEFISLCPDFDATPSIKMKTKAPPLLTCCLLILSLTAGLLRADYAADRRNERIPRGHKMRTPRREYVGPRPFDSSSPTGNGYTLQQLRHAYGLDQLTTTGQGQIIAIVDAYGSADIQADTDAFSAAMGIPSTAVNVYLAQGTAGSDPNFPNWAIETSLDVEWAHAIAPGATIVLVVAQSDSSDDLLLAVDYAVRLGATQVSMSWGGPEYSGETSSDYHFNVPGVTFFASSGDTGAYDASGNPGVGYPASSPNVVGVGGTTLILDSSGNYSSETAWTYDPSTGEGSGGGISAYELAPSYQAGLSAPNRGVPDVAYDADPATGVPVYFNIFGWRQYGGTSMSAPQWAALMALANSLRQQPVNSAPGIFYSLATANYAAYYHDITSGNNGVYYCGPGYDLVTGWGTPIANQLVIALAGGYSSQAAAPVFFPVAGVYPSGSKQNVTIVSATPGASIRYTTDGSTPTATNGTLYSGPVSISANATLTAIAYKSGLSDSPVNSGGYTFIPQVAAPVFTPAAGHYLSAQSVTISTPTSGASIRYTEDGSIPTETYGVLYSGPITINNDGAPTVINAVAYKDGLLDSPVARGAYTTGVLNIIYSFPNDPNSVAGSESGLVVGRDGNFYGTTAALGSNNAGTVFKMTPAGVVTTLVTFDGANGADPYTAALVQGSDGDFYGTTRSGGAADDGTVFKMTPSGVLTTLVSFTGANGSLPSAALVQGSDGNFYGTTEGPFEKVTPTSVYGTVFKMTPAGVLTTLVTFTGPNGAYPESALVQGRDGNFYGTTSQGGSSYNTATLNEGNGTVFKMTPSGVLTTLVSFGGTNWVGPEALVQASDGNFYGTTSSLDSGTAFKMTPAGVLTTLAQFGGGAVTITLMQASDGNFYGTTGYGEGVFKMTPAGGLTYLAGFSGDNGYEPLGGLVQGSDGNLYGTTSTYGAHGEGNIFQVILPPSVAAPAFSPVAGTYTSAQLVTITTTTSGASIRYSTDGTTPSETAGTIYSGPVSISATATLNAIAYKGGLTDSAVTTGAYTIDGGGITVSPANGFDNLPMSSSQSGTFTATFDASPSLSPSNTVIGLSKGAQTAYSGISCIARFNTSGDIDAYNGTGYGSSTIPYAAGLTYHFRMVVNVPANTYSVYVTPPGGSEVPVGLNYGFRRAATSLDTWNIDVNANPGGTVTVSDLTIIGTQQVAAPAFSPPAGTYASALAVTITSMTNGASIAYTTDGTIPTESGGTVTHGMVLSNGGSVSIGTTTTLNAIAFKGGLTDSTVTMGQYTVIPPQVAVPTFSPPAGTYTSAQMVTIVTTTSGASIRYTTDNSVPTETNGTVYSSPVSIGTTTTLKAIAYKSGLTDSTVTSGLYTITTVTRSLTGTSGNGWHALALTSAQTGTFTATFDATPTVSPENAVVGLSKGAVTAYSSLSCIARFNPSGYIDAYNGTGYGSSTITYKANVSYHFRLVVNVSAHTYSAYVTPAGGSELTVGVNYAFRTVQTSLDTWNLELNSTPSGCSLTANNLNP
jgi:uncharacterized repeat protein (TIGR03803 family)